MTLNSVHTVSRWRCSADGAERDRDAVAVEMPLEIRIGHSPEAMQPFIVTLCTPVDLDDLVRGFLFTEGLINGIQDLRSLQFTEEPLGVVADVLLDARVDLKPHLDNRRQTMHAGCGLCGQSGIDRLYRRRWPRVTDPTAPLDAALIRAWPGRMRAAQQAFRRTGGIHASAWFDGDGQLRCLREDIGRHNALDKLIGAWLRERPVAPMRGAVMLSGRVGQELVMKAVSAGVPVLAAIGAASSMALELAEAHALTVLGFVRAEGFNLYTCADRIQLET